MPQLTKTGPTNGPPYFSADDNSGGVLAANASHTGRWFNTEQQRVTNCSVQLTVGSPITGRLYMEFTSDPNNAMGISRVQIPTGALHVMPGSGVATANDGSEITVTAAASVSFSLSVAWVGTGRARFVWEYVSGGAAPNQLIGYAQYQALT